MLKMFRFRIIPYTVLLSIAVINTAFQTCDNTQGEYNLTGSGCRVMIELISPFDLTIVNTATAATYKQYQAALDLYDSNGTNILLAVAAPNSAPSEFGLVSTETVYTTIYGDISAGSSQGIVDGQGKAARIREIRAFTQSADGFIYFADRYVIRKIDRSSGNVTTIFGNADVARDNITSWDTITLDDIHGIAYDNDTDLLYINTHTLGLVMLDFTNKSARVVIPIAEFSSANVTDYGADIIFSPDKTWLYTKVYKGVNRYPVSQLSSEDANINYTAARWISSEDTSAEHQPAGLSFGGKSVGRLGFSPSGQYLLMVDHGENMLFLFDPETGGAASICGNDDYRGGNLSTCAFTEPTSFVWRQNNDTDSEQLNVFHYHSLSRSNKTNYLSVAGINDASQEQTTTTQSAVSTTQSESQATNSSVTDSSQGQTTPTTTATSAQSMSTLTQTTSVSITMTIISQSNSSTQSETQTNNTSADSHTTKSVTETRGNTDSSQVETTTQSTVSAKQTATTPPTVPTTQSTGPKIYVISPSSPIYPGIHRTEPLPTRGIIEARNTASLNLLTNKSSIVYGILILIMRNVIMTVIC